MPPLRCLLQVCVGSLMLMHGLGQQPCVNVTTLAGNGTFSEFADGQGRVATFYYPKGVAVDTNGLVYIADYQNNRIRTATPSGLVSTLAGNAAAAWADGTGAGASFNLPAAVAILPSTIYVADTYGNRIRRLTPAGVVDTLAGSGTSSWVDGQGTFASFKQPRGISVDAAGVVYVADTMNNRIRKISPLGLVTTLAGSAGLRFADGAGTTTATFNYPVGVAVDGSGRVFIGDAYNNRIRLIAPDGNVTTFAGGSSPGTSDGVASLASFYSPHHLAFAANGDLLVVDYTSHRVRTITPLGQVTTIAGSSPPGPTGGFADGLGTASLFNNPFGIAVGPKDTVYIGDNYNQRIRVLTACAPLNPLTPTTTPSPTPTITPASSSLTPSPSGVSPTSTPSPSPTPTDLMGQTPSNTPTPTPTPSPSPTAGGACDSLTPTGTPSPGGGGSTPSPTPTPSGSPTSSLSPGASPSTTPPPRPVAPSVDPNASTNSSATPPLSPGSTAGAVIGGLAGVAAIGAGVALLVRGNKSSGKLPVTTTASSAPAHSTEVVNNPLGGKGNHSAAAPTPNPAPQPPTQEPLPQGWTEMSDETGDVWYVGPTGESAWVRPT